MHLRNLLQQQNKHWDEGFKKYVPRDIFPQVFKALTTSRVVLALMGVRRAGKSVLVFQLINGLLDKGIPSENIFYLNFEDPFFVKNSASVELLDSLFREYLSLKRPEGDKYVFLDEVQNVPSWEQWIRTKYDTCEDLRITITGSNARLLSSELATKLTGRTLSFEIFPFNFREYLLFKGQPHFSGETLRETYLSNLKEAPIILGLFEQYLVEGGFPEALASNDAEIRLRYLRDYIRAVIYTDIVPRFDFRSAEELEKLAYYLLTNLGNKYSYRSLARNVGITDTSAKEYVSALALSYLFFEVEKYSFKFKNRVRAAKRPYVIDPGLRSLFYSKPFDDVGKLVENAVFLHFIRGNEVNYLEEDGVDIDFLVTRPERTFYPVSVSYTDLLSEREYGVAEVSSLGLFSSLKEQLKTGLLLTRNVFDDSSEDFLTVPVWVLLLTPRSEI
ncbi:AAA family ATPase [candidate division WWE3 bacterium]|nr:AAA family ATPase [candidate division WWE3 bacterium]